MRPQARASWATAIQPSTTITAAAATLIRGLFMTRLRDGSDSLPLRRSEASGRHHGASLGALRCAVACGQLHSVPWKLRARYTVSVAIITSAALGRWRSSRPVSYAVGPVGFHFSPTERRANAIRIFPTGILDPLWGGECRGCGENKNSGE